ncbi:MAG: ABC transporter permease subunit [Saccharofermentans sp.]|nr:ABC transporter permease subunit [Saccharofermentans sp.]
MSDKEQLQQEQTAEWQPTQLKLRSRMAKDIRINWQLYVMFIFPVIYYIIFRYIPMFGNILAFRKYYAGGNIFGEGPLTLRYFKQFITAKPFWDAFKNTLILNGLYLLFRFPLTLIFALLLNEIRNLHWKKFVQTVSYLPHFISMVIVCGMIKELLSTSGPVNDIIQQFGGEKINFIALAEWFRTIFVASGVWQSLGWGTILYLAAMSGINPSLYEAATVDGANHYQQVMHVTIPCILPTIATLLILDIGGLVGSGGAFEKVYLLYSPLTYETSDIVSTYVFRMGIESGSINFATAVGLFEGLINLVLLTCANFVSRKVANTSLW